MKLYILIFFSLWILPISAEKTNKSLSFMERIFGKKNKSAKQKIQKQQIKKDKKNILKTSSSKNSKTLSIKRQLSTKESIVGKDYYIPKQNKQQLNQNLNQHLLDIKNICKEEANQDPKKTSESLRQKIRLLSAFLKTSLQNDPYMTYELKIQFRNILDSLEAQDSDSLMSLESFTLSYRMLYNLPEDINWDDYSSHWAKVIHNALECIERIK